MKRIQLVLSLVLLIGAAASAGTLISFANPSSGTPFFDVDLVNNQITGSWDDSEEGLSLITHFTGGQVYENAWFELQTNTLQLGGEMNFYADNQSTPLLTITFDSALVSVGGLYTGSILMNDIEISGQLAQGYQFSDEWISFAFASQTPYAGGLSQGFTATASLDSSATVVPEPATMVLLSLGGLLLRRKK